MKNSSKANMYTGERAINNEKLDIIKEKIRKNINMGLLEIKEVFDEESKKFTSDVGTIGAYLKGLEDGKLMANMEMGLRLMEVFKEIEKNTGITFEELRFLQEKEIQERG